MPAPRKPMSPLYLFFVVVLSEFAIVALIVQPEYMAKVLEAEKGVYMRHLGEAAAKEIRAGADAWFIKSAINTGARQVTYEFVAGRHDRVGTTGLNQMDDRGFGRWAVRLLQTVWGAYYLVLYRAVAITSWVPYFIPLLFAAVVDASTRRAIAKWQFSYRSPLIHFSSLNVLTAVFLGTLAILACPITITPLWVPAAMVLVVFAAWTLVANMTKRV